MIVSPTPGQQEDQNARCIGMNSILSSCIAHTDVVKEEAKRGDAREPMEAAIMRIRADVMTCLLICVWIAGASFSRLLRL